MSSQSREERCSGGDDSLTIRARMDGEGGRNVVVRIASDNPLLTVVLAIIAFLIVDAALNGGAVTGMLIELVS